MTATTPDKTFPLALRPTAAAAGRAVAWFVPGADPAGWLAEVAAWGVPAAGVRFLVVPASAADPTPVGAVVVPDCGAGFPACTGEKVQAGKPAPRSQPSGVVRGQPYRAVAGRLYLPADAELWPPVAAAELAELLPLAAYVLHPTAGLSGFAAADVLTAADLLAPPAEAAADWGHAVPGDAVRPRVVSVAPADPPDVAGLLAAGRDDIGSAGPAALPRTPEESALLDAARRAGVAPAKLAEAIAMGPLKAMAWLSKQLGGNAAGAAGGPGWAQKMHDWAAGKFRDLDRRLRDQREREIERLRRMFDADPDEALRHAIPLRDVPTRGVAPPSGRLGTRDVSFSLSSALGGGAGGGDAWEIEEAARQALLRQYREAANRELRLGRYRRAAYVLAELLGDYDAAASALEQGRHHREAAVLYRDKLHNPLKAAECLERGGLLTEAAAGFEALKRFERAGDLHARLGEPAEAARCYRAQVAAWAGGSGRDLLPAAKLLEEKLSAPDEALALLTDAWPGRDPGGVCVRAAFDLFGRLGRHGDAADRARTLARGVGATGRGEDLAQALSSVAGRYPDDTVRRVAADATRVVAATELPRAGDGGRASIARVVAATAAADRLLARDAERFLARRDRRPAGPPPLRRAGGSGIVRQFNLPPGVAWHDVVTVAGGFAAAGRRDGRHVVARGTWAGAVQVIDWPDSVARGYASARLHPVPMDPVRVLVSGDAPRGLDARFPLDHTFPRPLVLVRPAWLPANTAAVGNGDGGVTWALADEPGFGGMTLSAYATGTGALLSSHLLAGLPRPPRVPDRLTVIAGAVLAPWGDGVMRFDVAAAAAATFPTHAAVTAVVPAPPPPAFCPAVASTRDGCLMVMPDGTVRRFADGLADPLIGFARSGAAVAVGADAGRVYHVSGQGLRLAREFPGPGAGVVAVTGTDQLDEFATFTAGGVVTVHRATGG